MTFDDFDFREEIRRALTDAGYDVEFVAFDGEHWVPTELIIPTVMELVGR